METSVTTQYGSVSWNWCDLGIILADYLPLVSPLRSEMTGEMVQRWGQYFQWSVKIAIAFMFSRPAARWFCWVDECIMILCRVVTEWGSCRFSSLLRRFSSPPTTAVIVSKMADRKWVKVCWNSFVFRQKMPNYCCVPQWKGSGGFEYLSKTKHSCERGAWPTAGRISGQNVAVLSVLVI